MKGYRWNNAPLEVRFWDKVDKRGPDECWEWQAYVAPHGYGSIAVYKRGMVWVHRVAYELLVGPIPVGHQVDHLCRNKRCVNPAHLEAVTQQENIRRQFAARVRSDVCRLGHPYETDKRGMRFCRMCARASARRRRRDRKAQRL